jgi:hypothetical protein
MSLESGGYSDKIGNRYESRWIAYLLFQLLEEKHSAIQVEPIGDDEEGVDVLIREHSGETRMDQCKASNANNDHWTLSILNISGVLTKANNQILRDIKEFNLVSPLASSSIGALLDSAKNSNDNPDDFYKYQIEPSTPRIKDFTSICNYLNLNTNCSDTKEYIFNFLKKFNIIQYNSDKKTKEELLDKANLLFTDPPEHVVAYLRSCIVEEDLLRHFITSSKLKSLMESKGFSFRVRPQDSRILPVINSIQSEFEDSIKPFFISKTLINRPELTEVLDSLSDNLITFIHADAGSGKSAFLFNIYSEIKKSGSLCLPIRLDRNMPETTGADNYGKQLGFPYSPVFCLDYVAPEQSKVIILDQLDAIRWSGSHSHKALSTCKEIVKQALQLNRSGHEVSILIACRSFDIKDDQEISAWLENIDEDVEYIELALLQEEVVKKAIAPFVNYDELSQEQKRILEIPLWLGIYIEVSKASDESPNFSTKLELIRAYWEKSFRELNQNNISTSEAENFLNHIVNNMDKTNLLSISERSIPSSQRSILSAFISIGILTSQNKRVSFRHQALFDFKIGESMYLLAMESVDLLLEELGNHSKQSLLKREHLKYALIMLFESSQKNCSDVIEGLLGSDKIRFHLQHLALMSLTGFKGIKFKKPIQNLILQILCNPKYKELFISNVCWGNEDIVSFLSEQGVINNWLSSGDESISNKAYRLLGSIEDKEPSIVSKEIASFIGHSENMNRQIYEALPRHIEDDGDELFLTRLSLLKQGCNQYYIDWKKLSKKAPLRALTLIEELLYYYEDELKSTSKYYENPTNKTDWLGGDFEEIKQIATQFPVETFERLFLIVNKFTVKLDYEQHDENWFHRDDYNSVVLAKLTSSVFDLLLESAKILLENTVSRSKIIESLSNNNSIIAYLSAHIFIYLPEYSADEVINWLLDNSQQRLGCGDFNVEPKWVLAGKLIEKFSPYCSLENFYQIENTIYRMQTDKSIDEIKWRLEAIKRNIYYHYWWEYQYFLLPKLDRSRTSNETSQLIKILSRKFSKYSDDDFCLNSKTTGGMVVSPILVPNALSDKAWRKIILSPPIRHNRHHWRQISEDVVAESSTGQFSSSLDVAVANEPIRFAKFALTLPSNIAPQYIKAFYYGLKKVDVKEVNEEYQSDWQLCPVDLVEKVINHFGSEEQVIYYLVWLLQDRITENGWTEFATDLLIKIATTSENPTIGSLNVTNSSNQDPDHANAHFLRNNAINSNRSKAFIAISRLMRLSESTARKLKYLIEIAINDPHPAVNTTAVDMLLAYWDYDKEYVFHTFIDLCNKDLRMSLGNGTHYFFNEGFNSYPELFKPLVKKMMVSKFDDIKEQAGFQLLARWFFYGYFESEIEGVLIGDIPLRKGACKVLKQFLGSDKYYEQLPKLLPIYERLVNDSDKEIRRELNWHMKRNNNNYLIFFDVYAQSKTATDNLHYLFYSFEKLDGSVMKYHPYLVKLVNNIISVDQSENSNFRMDVKDSSITNLLMRIYDEASEDEDEKVINECLDMFDQLLASGLYNLAEKNKYLDNGLLS